MLILFQTLHVDFRLPIKLRASPWNKCLKDQGLFSIPSQLIWLDSHRGPGHVILAIRVIFEITLASLSLLYLALWRGDEADNCGL